MLRFLRYVLEILGAFIGVAVFSLFLLAWKLSSAPLPSDFLTPYLETGIESIVSDSTAKIEKTLLVWNAPQRVFEIRAQNIFVSNAHNIKIAEIPSVDIKISLLGLVFGQFVPKELIVNQPHIKLDRNKNGVVAFGGVTVSDGKEKAPAESVGSVFDKIARKLSRSVFMNTLAVKNASVEIHDEEQNKDFALSIPEASVKRHLLRSVDRAFRGGILDGHIALDAPHADAKTALDIRYAYDPLPRQHGFSFALEDFSPALLLGGHPEVLGLNAAKTIALSLSGKIDVTLNADMVPVKANIKIHGNSGHLNFPDFWDLPRQVASLDVTAKFNRDARDLSISETRIDFGGPVLSIKASGHPSVTKGRDLDFSANIEVDNLPMDRFAEVWPKPILANPRDWLTTNLHKGVYRRADVAIKGSVSFDDPQNPFIEEATGKIDAKQGSVTYIEGMPSIDDVDAAATFDLQKMDVKILGGGTGNIRLSPFTIRITGLSEYDQFADIPAKISGPISEVLRLLDHPPLGYAKALGLSANDFGGKIAGTVKINLPLLKSLKTKDLEIHATATSEDASSTKIIPGTPIDQGRLSLSVDGSGLDLKGDVTLGKAPFSVTWRENFEETPDKPLRELKATGTIRDDQWSSLGLSTFKNTKGPTAVSLNMSSPTKNKTVYSGTFDMTPAAISVDALNWKKPANIPAILKFEAVAISGKPVSFSSITLHGTRLSASGTATFSPDMSALLSFNFPTLILGRTNASLSFAQSLGDKGALRFNAKGAALDVTGLRGGNDPGRADPRPKEYRLQVKRLFTAEDGEIRDVKAFASRDRLGWREINLNGLADGDTPLSIELSPHADGHKSFVIACNNFGKAIKGLGFTNTVKGGKISVTGQSAVDAPRTLNGRIKISDFTVEKLPVLALLLNAASPFGFPGLLTDSASFGRLKGDFVWKGDSLTFKNVHAAGSAIGINLEGDVDMNSGVADLSGTLVPFSMVNSVLNSIPLIGDLITGGENQGVLAVNYTISGNLNSPSISVNPISLLTPGFLRNLFFGEEENDETETPEQ